MLKGSSSYYNLYLLQYYQYKHIILITNLFYALKQPHNITFNNIKSINLEFTHWQSLELLILQPFKNHE